MSNSKIIKIFNSFGPGILYAGAAIGGSHLIQSTRAGANYGFSLVFLVLAVLIFKYPFFEFSYRYTIAQKESIIHGYRRLGKPILILFFIIAFISAILNAAALTLITSALAINLLNLNSNLVLVSSIFIFSIFAIIYFGKYKLLDNFMKVIVFLLSVATIFAFFIAAKANTTPINNFFSKNIIEIANLSFLLAIMGWLPTPIDVGVWPSLWNIEKHKEDLNFNKKAIMLDFNTGYILTGILSFAFLGLGAFIMYGKGVSFSNSGVAFSGQLVDLYTKSIGEWSKIIISFIAFVTIYSTTITTFDGYSRTLSKTTELLKPKFGLDKVYWLFFVVISIGSLLIIGFFIQKMKVLIDIATIIAFLTAPILAAVNFALVHSKHINSKHKPHIFLNILSILGLIFLTGFSVVFLISLFM
jgi:Mn2+/Fe2+ NRAMP family transporter